MATSIQRNWNVVIKQFFFTSIFTAFSLCGFAQTDSISTVEISSVNDQLIRVEPAYFRNLIAPSESESSLSSVTDSHVSELLNLKIEVPKMETYKVEKPYVALSRVFSYSPFIASYSLNSSATYCISEKMSLTGSNFSANSVFGGQPFENSPEKMNIQGVNLQLEYKVSDKFRIGGGVQIYHQSNGF